MAKESVEPAEKTPEDLSEKELAQKIDELNDKISNFRPTYPELDPSQPEFGTDNSDDTIGEEMDRDMKECLSEYKKRTGKDYVFAKPESENK